MERAAKRNAFIRGGFEVKKIFFQRIWLFLFLGLLGLTGSAGKGSELLTLPGAGQVFNFIDQEKGRFAREKTILFLNQYLTPFWGSSKEGEAKE